MTEEYKKAQPIVGAIQTESIPSSEEVWLRVLCAAIPTNDLESAIDMAKEAVCAYELHFGL